MKITQIYLLAIVLLLYVTYSRQRDEQKIEHQQAEIHRQFCTSSISHPNCK